MAGLIKYDLTGMRFGHLEVIGRGEDKIHPKGSSTIKWDCKCEYGKTVPIHRVVLNYPEGRVVDHINGNKSDNRKENLRVTTNQGNTQNKINKIKGTSSKYFGVSKSGNKWQSEIKHNKKHHYLGVFDTEEEAAIAYDLKAIELGFLTRNFLPKELTNDPIL